MKYVYRTYFNQKAFINKLISLDITSTLVFTLFKCTCNYYSVFILLF